jgi:zinc protease
VRARPAGPIGAAIPALLAVLLAAPGPTSGAETGPSRPSRRTLENGSVLVYQRDESSAVTVLGIVVRGAGRAAEPEGKQGLAQVVTRLTLEITDEGKAQDLMSQSTRLSTVVEPDYALILVESLSPHFEHALKTASEIILDPLFSGLRINYIKEAMAHQARLEQDDAVRAGLPAAWRAFFGPSGYGASAFGTEDSRKAIGKDDIRGFYREHFRAGALSFVIVSDLEGSEIEGWLGKYFARLPAGAAPPPIDRTGPARREPEIKIAKESKQSFVSVAFPLPALSLETYVLGSLLETGLGKGIGSKLWPLRSEARLAYNVGARASFGRAGGVLEAYLETDASKAAAAREALDASLKDFAAAAFSPEDLQTTKAYAKADFLRAYESKEPRVRLLAFGEGSGLGPDAFLRFAELVDAVEPEQINRFSREVLDPGRAARILIGRLD